MKKSEIDVRLSSQKSKRTQGLHNEVPDWKRVFVVTNNVNVQRRELLNRATTIERNEHR